MAAVFFLPSIESIVVLCALMLGAVIQDLILARLGFVRLLGLGHFQWFPMLLWLYTRIDSIQQHSTLFGWVVLVFMFNGISLVIDVIDVIRYLCGEKQPTITLRELPNKAL
jgi:hypothetical protein